MLPRSHNELSQKQQQALGLPDGFKVYSCFPFGGMNQQDSRMGMDDAEFSLRENYMRIGKGKLRTVWDQGSAIYTAPNGKTIVYFFFFNIGPTNYVAVFLSDGTAVQVNPSTLATTTMSAVANTFYTGGQLPASAQWGSQYLVTVNNITSNSYWIWDGSILYTAGTLGPQVTITSGGAGYSSAPTTTLLGGSGTGATFAVEISNGSVVSVTLTNPGSGYEPTDTVQLVFSGGGSDTGAELAAVLSANTVSSITLTSGGSGYSSPTVTISGGGGTGATATATEVGGVITAITVTNPGSGYTSTPSVSISGGTGATAVAVLGAGSLASVTVTNGGTNYTKTPTLTVLGGGGSGATAVATLTSGSISSVTVTAGGSGYTSTPQIVVESGVNNAASATPTLMPFGVSGASIETFSQRLWIPYPNQQGNQVNGGTFLVSTPSSLTDFATSDGGLVYISSSPFLRAQYTNIKQSNGYLYPIGDSSVDVISNVQTSGTPSTTTFNYQNTDPQTGTSWRDSVVAYSRTILMANQFGVFGLYGGSVAKISSKLDDLFTNAIFPPNPNAVFPCSAVADIFSQKVFMLLMTFQDPLTEAYRTALVAWDEKDWMILSQASTLTYISTQEVNSDLTAWGTDGTSLFPLFNAPSTNIEKRLSTKLYGSDTQILVKEAQMLVVQAQDNSAGQAGISFSAFTVDNELESLTMPNNVAFNSPKPQNGVYSAKAAEVPGCNLGLTCTSVSPDFTLNYLGLGYTEISSIYGNTPLTGQEEE